MLDATKNGMLRLLQCKLEPRRWLNVRRASQVCDAVQRDVVEPLAYGAPLHVQTDAAHHKREGRVCSCPDDDFTLAGDSVSCTVGASGITGERLVSVGHRLF